MALFFLFLNEINIYSKTSEVFGFFIASFCYTSKQSLNRYIHTIYSDISVHQTGAYICAGEPPSNALACKHMYFLEPLLRKYIILIDL